MNRRRALKSREIDWHRIAPVAAMAACLVFATGLAAANEHELETPQETDEDVLSDPITLEPAPPTEHEVGNVAPEQRVVITRQADRLRPSDRGRGRFGGDFFVATRIIGSFGKVNNLQVAGLVNTLEVQQDADFGGGAALVVGYRFARWPLRIELEVGHRYRFDLDFLQLTKRASNVNINFETNLSTSQALVNLLYEWRNQSSLIPFVGGTLGWAANRAVSERSAGGCKKCGSLPLTSIDAIPDFARADTTVHNLAWGVMAGVDWEFSERWSLELGYRYINLGDFDTGFFPQTDDRASGGPYISHDILISLLFGI